MNKYRHKRIINCFSSISILTIILMTILYLCLVLPAQALEEKVIVEDKLRISSTEILLTDDEVTEAVLDYIKKKRGSLPLGIIRQSNYRKWEKITSVPVLFRDSDNDDSNIVSNYIDYIDGWFIEFCEYYKLEPKHTGE